MHSSNLVDVRAKEAMLQQVVQHEAGIPYGDRMVSIDDVMDPQRMSAILEEMKPLWKPGTACGYHALTFGFLLDQIVRRIDPFKRGIEQYFREEICDKFGNPFVSIQTRRNKETHREQIAELLTWTLGRSGAGPAVCAGIRTARLHE